MPMVECNANSRDAINRVSTEPRVSTIIDASTLPDPPITVTKNKFGPQSKNLAFIIRGFKSSVTTNARKINAGFDWQSKLDSSFSITI